MPALYTHYKFGKDVLNELDFKEEILNNIKYYDMYNQGFDNLYYHYKLSYYKKFGIKAHSYNIEDFFRNIFKYINDNKLNDNSKIANILYGFINHYTLDTIIHPYINYQVKNLNIPHTKIEYMLDYYLFKKTNSKWENKIYKTLIPKLKFDEDVINFINYVFEETYNEKEIGKVFNTSHNNSYYIYRYLVSDLYGIKKSFYKIADFISKSNFKYSENTFTKEIDVRILNNEKLTWYNPKSKDETYSYSFEELYQFTQDICIYLCNNAYEVLNNKLDIEDFIKLINSINLNNLEEFKKD